MELSEVASILETLKEKVSNIETAIQNVKTDMLKKEYFDNKLYELQTELSEIKSACAK